jgi:hypothetical protein
MKISTEIDLQTSKLNLANGENHIKKIIDKQPAKTRKKAEQPLLKRIP